MSAIQGWHPYQQIARLISERAGVKPDWKVLEVGCGKADILRQIDCQRFGHDHIDYGYGDDMTFTLGDAGREPLPYVADYFDFAFIHGVVQCLTPAGEARNEAMYAVRELERVSGCRCAVLDIPDERFRSIYLDRRERERPPAPKHTLFERSAFMDRDYVIERNPLKVVFGHEYKFNAWRPLPLRPKPGGSLQFILMAGGTARRWENYLGVPKQLAPIAGEPVIVRTCRQVQDRLGIHPVVVTRDPVIMAAVGQGSCFTEFDDRWISSAGLSCRELWRDRTWMIDGDTYWSADAMDQLCSLDRLCGVWKGTQFLGFAFGIDDADRMEASLRACVLAAETTHHKMTGRSLGYFNYAFHLMQGGRLVEEPPSLHANQHYKGSALVEEIEGVCLDFDAPRDYDQFVGDGDPKHFDDLHVEVEAAV